MTVLSQTTKRFQRPSLFNNFVYFWQCWVFTSVRAFCSTCSEHGATWAESLLAVGPGCLLAHESWLSWALSQVWSKIKRQPFHVFFFSPRKLNLLFVKNHPLFWDYLFSFGLLKCLFAFSLMQWWWWDEMMKWWWWEFVYPYYLKTLRQGVFQNLGSFFRQVIEYMSPILHNSPGRSWVDTHNQSNISAVKCKNIYTKWDRKTCG